MGADGEFWLLHEAAFRRIAHPRRRRRTCRFTMLLAQDVFIDQWARGRGAYSPRLPTPVTSIRTYCRTGRRSLRSGRNTSRPARCRASREQDTGSCDRVSVKESCSHFAVYA